MQLPLDGPSAGSPAWRRNEDALPLLGNKLATDRYDIWRKHTEWALAILENDAVEISALCLSDCH